MKKIIYSLIIFFAFTGIVSAQCIPVPCTYSTSTIPFALSSPGTTSVSNCDDCLTTVPVGFNFGFMCATYSSVQIGSNGFLSFDPNNMDDGCCSGGNIPDPNTPNGLIALFWTDLDNSNTNSITYGTFGTAPNRIFVATYSDVPICCSSTYPHSGQVKLFENSGVIEIHIASIPNSGNTLTQGIEDVAGTVGYTTNVMAASGFSATNIAVRYTPVTFSMVPLPTGPISGPVSVCPGTITATYSVAAVPGATSYAWSLPAGWNGTSTTNTISAGVSSSGELTITPTYTCGTGSEITLSVTAGIPTISVNSGVVCSGSSFTLTPSGADTYTFEGGNSVVSPTANTTYTVIGSGFGNCLSANVATANISVIASPNLTITGNTPYCMGTATNVVTVSGADTYTWSTGPTTSTVAVSPLSTTIYSVSGTSISNGCTSVISFTQTVKALPPVGATSGFICSGNSFTIVPSGADSYTFTNGGPVVSPTLSTQYSVVGTSTLTSCTGTVVSTVSVLASPSVSLSAANYTSCVNGSTISLTGTPSGGSYNGTNVAGTFFNPASAGTFQPIYIYINPSTGCAGSASITIVVDPCAGLKEFGRNSSITNIFPNPTSGIVTLDVVNPTKITITNVLGKVLSTENLNTGKQNIDLRSYDNGIYIVKFSDHGKEHTFKLIKE